MTLSEFESKITSSLKGKFGGNIITWVWPEYAGVKGFYGTGLINNAVVIWITERPALARNKLKEHKFPDWIVKRFYGLLKDEGLTNMHFTDFVKVMDTAGKNPTEEELAVSAEWMQTEIEMLRSRDKKLIIVANSKRLKKWMDNYLPTYPYIYRPFFKYLFRFGKADQLQKILKGIYRMTI